MAVDQGTFRRAVARFATGVCVVTSLEGRADHAMTVNSFTSVSLEPLLVLFCVEKEARFYDAVIDSGVWGVSILNPDQRPAASWLSNRGRPLVGQLDRIPHHRGPETGVALLDGAVATMECRTTAVHEAGDHDIVIGEVVGAAVPASGPADEAGALLWHRGAYSRI
ncbi:flavin reductase family protein [Kineosporia succinea]|uniref:Flavin reductase (DIM6/NTAB) family NADH-FMN oxidoreductase RutF n=1 Tax=Kineosporia succinea TaxID=84632 RepID=A0ABT9NYI6_9ACTN|nr:flavin reductase family protein [Kineosporia succinea]MDP9825502.1 flavin reductase (DIM6/NTAB) family NADH-FMN oxidoreductase RutF [Kineosporia succinea]